MFSNAQSLQCLKLVLTRYYVWSPVKYIALGYGVVFEVNLSIWQKMFVVCRVLCSLVVMDVCFTVCCFWIRCGICGPSQDPHLFHVWRGFHISKFMVCCLALSPFGLKSWLYSWLVVKMSRCWSCFKPSTCEDRIRSDLRQGLCNKCFRSLSCHRCHACVQRSSPRMIEFLHIPGLWDLTIILKWISRACLCCSTPFLAREMVSC